MVMSSFDVDVSSNWRPRGVALIRLDFE